MHSHVQKRIKEYKRITKTAWVAASGAEIRYMLLQSPRKPSCKRDFHRNHAYGHILTYCYVLDTARNLLASASCAVRHTIHKKDNTHGYSYAVKCVGGQDVDFLASVSRNCQSKPPNAQVKTRPNSERCVMGT